MLSIFFHVFGHVFVLFGEVSIPVLGLFLNWIVFLPGVELYEFFIYIRDKTLAWGIIDKYASHKIGSLFILMMVSLAVQKLFNLM